MTEQVQAPVKPPARFHWIPILSLAAVAIVVLWHFGVFRSKPRVAIVTSGDTPYWDQVAAGAEEAARVYDVNLTVVRCKTDPQVQKQAIADLLEKSLDGIAISPINPLLEAVSLADVAAKCTLVTIDSDSPVARRLCFVGTDNYAAGRLCGQLVQRALPDGGEIILLIGNLEKENTQLRRQGVIDELLARPFDPGRTSDPDDAVIKGERYIVVKTLLDEGKPDVAIELASKAMKEHPGVKAFVGLLGYSTPALLKSIDSAGKLGQIKIVGFDANDETLAGIEAGNVYGTIMQDQFGMGFHTVRILAETARGDASGLPTFQRRTLPVELVTMANVADIKQQMRSGNRPTTMPN